MRTFKSTCVVFLSWVLALGPLSAACSDSEKDKKKSDGKNNDGVPVTAEAQKKEATRLLRLKENLPPVPAADAPTEKAWELDPALEPGSYDVTRPVAVYRRPSTKSKIIGAVSKYTRLPRVKRVKGKGCSAGFFLKLADGAYVCGANLKASKRPPFARKEPQPGANNLTPGTYGYIRTGGAKLYWTLPDGYAGKKGKPIQQSDTVRWAGKRFYKGMKFWRITTGHFIRGDRIRRFWPSRFKGVSLKGTKKRLPLVFMVGRRRRKIGEKIPPVEVHETPKGKVLESLKRYTAWPVDDIKWKGEDRWFHIPGKGWVVSELTRLARLTDPPKGLHPRERWIDVDLEEQILTAYRGQRPVYTTLISAGVWKYPTPTGTFRIFHKKAEADMRADPTADEQYRADHVPWTLYFKGGYALHGTYWHNGFGHARSHGCINLSPRDAAFIYHFSCPKVPKGWTALYADEDHPGTLVRIRGKSRKEKGTKESDEEKPDKEKKQKTKEGKKDQKSEQTSKEAG